MKALLKQYALAVAVERSARVRYDTNLAAVAR